jgi:hypothetical protein
MQDPSAGSTGNVPYADCEKQATVDTKVCEMHISIATNGSDYRRAFETTMTGAA